ncbi:MAG: hypothetical protein AVDCRST_MAG25-1891, partial [uncultured Rubrobacteraceae bacterium]
EDPARCPRLRQDGGQSPHRQWPRRASSRLPDRARRTLRPGGPGSGHQRRPSPPDRQHQRLRAPSEGVGRRGPHALWGDPDPLQREERGLQSAHLGRGEDTVGHHAGRMGGPCGVAPKSL